MIRRPPPIACVPLPALLVVLAAARGLADEPFPFPAPPVRSQPAMYLSPESPPAIPDGSPTEGRAGQPLTPSAGQRTAQAPAGEPAPRGGLVPPARKSVVADTTETDRRVERLRRQLDELNEMLSRPPVEPPVIERTITTPLPTTDPAPAASPKDLAVEPPPPVVETPAVVEKSPVDRSLAEPAPASPTTAPRTLTNTGKLTANGLIKGLPVAAIDRVHVADNLFAAAEYVLASEIYLQVDRKAISADESGWVEFQLANCSRRLGRIDDAKKRYRRVVSDPTLGWLQDMAKWRLDAIDEREQLMQEHARLEAAIQKWTEAPRAPAQQ